MSFVPVTEAIEEIRAGRMLVVVDDEDRENEGDLTIAAEKITPEIVNFMIREGRGPSKKRHAVHALLQPLQSQALERRRLTDRVTQPQSSQTVGF